MAQWIRRWSTEPEILGSIPSEVVDMFIFGFATYPCNLGSIFGIINNEGFYTYKNLTTSRAKQFFYIVCPASRIFSRCSNNLICLEAKTNVKVNVFK